MMTKLKKPLLIILIGLSLFLLKGCVIFGIGVEDQSPHVMTGYVNISSLDVELVIHNDPLNGTVDPKSTYYLNSGESIDLPNRDFLNKEEDGILPIDNYVSLISREEAEVTYEIYSESNELLKQWTVSNTQDSDHSPFNVDSWEYIEFDSHVENNEGKIVFTITDEDLE